jgi:hypothetical protein
MYDKFETLATQSSIAVAVLSDVNVTDIELLPIRPRSIPNDKIHELTRLWSSRGLQFIGVAGVVAGMPQLALATPLDDVRIDALAEAFAVYCNTLLPGHVEEQRKGDEVVWLERLFSLPDTRA